MAAALVLSLFPGIGLLDAAFEEQDFCVVRGPDLLWGGDIKRFRPPAGKFDGVIGGPPCQAYSTARKIAPGDGAEDLIHEFVRCCEEAAPRWIVMENVRAAFGRRLVPADWHPCRLRDWDCGGETHRTRYFWTWPFALLEPSARPGNPSYSVLASTAKKGRSRYASDKRFLGGALPLDQYERLQGAPGVMRSMVKAGASKQFAVRLLGNGVPLAMGRTVARAVRQSEPATS